MPGVLRLDLAADLDVGCRAGPRSPGSRDMRVPEPEGTPSHASRNRDRPEHQGQAQARRRPVGARLPRAAEQERGKQAERRRAQRPPADHRRLLQVRLRLHRPGRPARPVSLVRAVHPATARHRRRQDRGARAGGARRPLLHAADPHRRRPAVQRPAAGHRLRLAPVRARRSRTSRTSGTRWNRSGCPPPRRAATPRG